VGILPEVFHQEGGEVIDRVTTFTFPVSKDPSPKLSLTRRRLAHIQNPRVQGFADPRSLSRYRVEIVHTTFEAPLELWILSKFLLVLLSRSTNVNPESLKVDFDSVGEGTWPGRITD
jgi:hypothetical protein